MLWKPPSDLCGMPAQMESDTCWFENVIPRGSIVSRLLIEMSRSEIAAVKAQAQYRRCDSLVSRQVEIVTWSETRTIYDTLVRYELSKRWNTSHKYLGAYYIFECITRKALRSGFGLWVLKILGYISRFTINGRTLGQRSCIMWQGAII